jgi:hypothetical protein
VPRHELYVATLYARALPDFTPHDLLRTAASLMTAHGVPRLHVEKVFNDTLNVVAEISDRHDYSAEKPSALERLAECLKRVLRDRSCFPRSGGH